VIHRQLVCADDFSVLVKYLQTVKKNTEALYVDSKKVDLRIIAVETKCTHVPRGQNVKQNFGITRGRDGRFFKFWQSVTSGNDIINSELHA
jgi:hypothetical protein